MTIWHILAGIGAAGTYLFMIGVCGAVLARLSEYGKHFDAAPFVCMGAIFWPILPFVFGIYWCVKMGIMTSADFFPEKEEEQKG